jgi:hypothetical protein
MPCGSKNLNRETGHGCDFLIEDKKHAKRTTVACRRHLQENSTLAAERAESADAIVKKHVVLTAALAGILLFAWFRK